MKLWKMDEEIVAAQKRVQGEDHPETLHAMANMAMTHWNLGSLKGAHTLLVSVNDTAKAKGYHELVAHWSTPISELADLECRMNAASSKQSTRTPPTVKSRLRKKLEKKNNPKRQLEGRLKPSKLLQLPLLQRQI